MFDISSHQHCGNTQKRPRPAERAIFYTMLIVSACLVNAASAAETAPEAGMYSGDAVYQSVGPACDDVFNVKAGDVYRVDLEYPGAPGRKWRMWQTNVVSSPSEMVIGKMLLVLNPGQSAVAASGTAELTSYSQSEGRGEKGLPATWQAQLGPFDDYSFTMQFVLTFDHPGSLPGCTVKSSIAFVRSGGLPAD